MIQLKIKPLSINECWKGRRFKTATYSLYEKEVLWMLRFEKLPPKPYKVQLEFGLSNQAADIDNPVKPLLDIFQKKYGFNDKDVVELNVKKVIVKKGSEYFKYKINHYEM